MWAMGPEVRHLALLGACVLSFVLAGCGSEESGGHLPGVTQRDPGKPVGVGGGSSVECEYPEAEYGYVVEDVLPPSLSWSGFGDGEDSPRLITIDEYLDCTGAGDTDALLILQAAEWCDVCAAEAEEVQELMDGDWADRNIRVVTLVTETDDGIAADVETARRWKDAFQLTTAVVADPEFTFAVDTTLLPQSILVNPRSMRVFFHALGGVSIVQQMEALLDTTR